MWRPFVLIVLVGCSTTMRLPKVDENLAVEEAHNQRIVALNRHNEQMSRLNAVAFDVQQANQTLCGDAASRKIGVSFLTIDAVDKEWRRAYQDIYQLTDRVTIISTTENSPAAEAGLAAGDVIIELFGENIGVGKKGLKKAIKLFEQHSSSNVSMKLRRGGQILDVEVEPVWVCEYPVILTADDAVNAWTDGKSVYMTTGMLRFTDSDDALALIIGHEMAHITLGHIGKKKTNAIIGGILGAVVATATTAIAGVPSTGAIDDGIAAGAGAFSQAFESEADYVGTFYAARAGYDIAQGVKIWREIAAVHPNSIHLKGSTHPSTARRFLAIENTLAEINEKKKKGLPIAPSKRE